MKSRFYSESFVKVLIVDLSRDFGGASSRVLSLLRYLPAGQVGFVGLENSPVSLAAKKLSIPVHCISSSKVKPIILWRLIKIIRQGGYQVIDTHNIQSKLWGSMAAIVTGKALVSTLHSWYGSEHKSNSWRGRFYTHLEKHTNSKLSLYITVAKTIKEALLESGFQSSKVELIHNAVFIDSVAIPEYKKQLDVQFAIPGSSTIFTAVGRLVPVKGYGALIRSFREVAFRYPDSYCLIVGDGELRKELNEIIQENELQNKVYLLGYCDHNTVLSIIKSSDVFVMPSQSEGTPIALLEAAALGKAIIASDVGGIPELVSNGEHAILIPPSDHEALIQALIKFADNQNLRDAYGKRAQQRVQEKFDIDTMINSTYEAYKKAWKLHQTQKKSSS